MPNIGFHKIFIFYNDVGAPGDARGCLRDPLFWTRAALHGRATGGEHPSESQVAAVRLVGVAPFQRRPALVGTCPRIPAAVTPVKGVAVVAAALDVVDSSGRAGGKGSRTGGDVRRPAHPEVRWPNLGRFRQISGSKRQVGRCRRGGGRRRRSGARVSAAAERMKIRRRGWRSRRSTSK